MARDRTLPIDFWSWEAVIDCAMPSRLLFLGLWNFADEHGVMPLRPRMIRYQVFPGDEIDDDTMRVMIDELASRKLLRVYEVEGIEYLAIVDWARLHGIRKRARRRHPADPSVPAVEPPPPAPTPVPADAVEAVPPDLPRPATIAQPERWRRMIKNLLRQYWARHPLIELMDDDAADRWTAKWIAQGCDFRRDIVPVVRDFCAMKPYCGPPVGFQELDEHVARSRARREEETTQAAGNDAVTTSRSFDHAGNTNFPAPCEMPYAQSQGS